MPVYGQGEILGGVMASSWATGHSTGWLFSCHSLSHNKQPSIVNIDIIIDTNTNLGPITIYWKNTVYTVYIPFFLQMLKVTYFSTLKSL